MSFSFTPIWLTRCWGHNKWRLDGNGTAVGFGLLVGVPVLQQMAPVGWGLIGKEVSVPDAERRLAVARCWGQELEQGKAETQLVTVDPGLSPLSPNQVTDEADDAARVETI